MMMEVWHSARNSRHDLGKLLSWVFLVGRKLSGDRHKCVENAGNRDGMTVRFDPCRHKSVQSLCGIEGKMTA